VIYFPVTSTSDIAPESESPNLKFPFLYEGKKAPNPTRQDTSHPHQVIEGEGGKLYVPDLGNDRIWIVKREGESGLKVDGYLQSNEGAGPRHAALSTDGGSFPPHPLITGKHLYVLTELHSSLLIFDLTTDSQHPLPETETSLVPPNVPSTHSIYMNAAELIVHPTIPRVLYGSNRLELQIPDKAPSLPEIPKTSGDTVAIILLNEAGDRVEQVKHVRTGCDAVRGMQISKDGKYIALAGQYQGGVEVWSVGGERGDVWKLAAKEEAIKGVNDFVWL
jgi:6-phosphogluconolactonase (cycloisomerase 2 family)